MAITLDITQCPMAITLDITKCPVAITLEITQCPMAITLGITQCPMAITLDVTKCPMAITSDVTKCPMAITLDTAQYLCFYFPNTQCFGTFRMSQSSGIINLAGFSNFNETRASSMASKVSKDTVLIPGPVTESSHL